MRINVVHPSELGPAEVAVWHDMQRATPSLAHPFLSPEFVIAVGHHRQPARVAVITDGQAPIGFFPFEQRQFGVGVPISGWLSAYQGVIHAPGADLNPWKLMPECGLAAYQFDNLIPDQMPSRAYPTAICSSPIIDLSEGFNPYYTKLRVRASHMCRELERKARKIGREIGELHLVCDSQDVGLLRSLMSWKSEQYRLTNHVDRFAPRWVGELLEQLLIMRADNFSGLLSVVYAGDQPVAAHFGLRSGGLLVGWFTGYDKRFARYSPGSLLVRLMAEELCRVGVSELHMGKGAKRYTEMLKNSEIFVGEGVAATRTMVGTAHLLRGGLNMWALRTVRNHRALHDAADLVLRRTRISCWAYGRM